MDLKKLRRILLVTATFGMVGLAPTAQGAESGKGTTGNGVTFHKGWKQRKTPYKPTWGPSLCGGGGKSRVVKKATTKKTTTSHSKSVSKKRSVRPTFDSRREVQESEYQWAEKHYMDKLKEIHAAQMELVKNKERMTPEQRQAKIKEIQKAYPLVVNTISKTKDFPFPSQLWNMDQVLKAVRFKMIRSEFSGDGKTDVQLLKEIQDKQFERFKKTIDDEVRSRRSRNRSSVQTQQMLYLAQQKELVHS